MANTTQKDKTAQYKTSIVKSLESITDKLNAYHTINATLSDETLMKVNAYLMAADRCLESGFIKDSCEEIDEYFKKNN